MTAVEALRAGGLVVLPTDTVYGVCALATDEDAVRALATLKGRDPAKPIALVGADVDTLLSLVPELPEPLLRTLLPGAYTLVLPNPARRFPTLAGSRPETLGVRVPVFAGEATEVMRVVGAVGATSANPSGGREPRSVEELDPQIRAGVASIVDGGELPGTPSTVLDLTSDDPVVLREGAVPAAEALARAREAQSG